MPVPPHTPSLQHHGVFHQPSVHLRHQFTRNSGTGCNGTTALLSLLHALESRVSIYKVLSWHEQTALELMPC